MKYSLAILQPRWKICQKETALLSTMYFDMYGMGNEYLGKEKKKKKKKTPLVGFRLIKVANKPS